MNKLNKSLKVCMYTPTAKGGHARYTFELINSVMNVGQNQKIKVELVTSKNISKDYISNAYVINNILPILKERSKFSNKLEWVIARLFYYLRREILFFKWVKKKDFNIIHFQEYSPLLGSLFFWLLKKLGFKLIYTVHNIYDHKYPFRWIKPFIDSDHKISWRMCDGLIVHSEIQKDQLNALLGKGAPQIYVIPHLVWTINKKIDINEDPNLKLSKGTLIFFGVIRPNKGLPYLLKALALLREFNLIIAGQFEDIEYKNRIMKLLTKETNEINLIDRYISNDEMIELFSKSSAAILPYESFYSQSGVLHDAIALETPVVVTNVGALGEYVKKYDIGEVVQPRDFIHLAEAIKYLHIKERYDKVISNIKNLKNIYSAKSIALETIKVYKKILNFDL